MKVLHGHTMFAALLLALAAHPASAQERVIAVADPGPDVETVGTGERRIAPDRATVNLLVESKATEASSAAAANARAAQAVRDTLRRLGLDSAATTASYTVGTDYEPPRPTRDEGPRRVGYVARTLIRVQLNRIDQVGRVIDASLATGATGVQGVFFEASTAPAARREALASAATAARQDAETLARALGGSLGALISTSTASGLDPRRPNVMLREAAGGYSTQITPTEIVVTAGVVTKWRFIPGR
ncbi:MAG: SIMPL domain-containing protein [Gemmatimonadaceae bacterium]